MAFSSIFKISAIIFLSLFFMNCYNSKPIQGYYWREFFGEIPSDAYPGGRDRNGNPIYIGQILHEYDILTTQIFHNDPKGYYDFLGKEHSGTENQKILCTQYPDNFVWVPTKHDEIHLLTNRDIVLGGAEPGHTMYIGRVFYKSQTTMGKVSTGKTENYGLYILDGGNEVNLKSFEILTYNSSDSNSDSDISADCIYNLLK